ncbi:hypothetical protein ACOSQ2_011595 [Xanthoceras sorbifolium]
MAGVQPFVCLVPEHRRKAQLFVHGNEALVQIVSSDFKFAATYLQSRETVSLYLPHYFPPCPSPPYPFFPLLVFFVCGVMENIFFSVIDMKQRKERKGLLVHCLCTP